MRLKCQRCGKAFYGFQQHQKYCSTECYHVDSRSRSRETGIKFRKRAMALGVHGDDTLVIVWRKLVHSHAPEWERLAILDDLLRERASVKSEVRGRYKRIGKRRKATLRKLGKELDRRARREWEWT